MSVKEDGGSDEGLLGSDRESDELEWTRPNQRQSWRRYAWVGSNLLLFLISLGLFVTASFRFSSESEMDYIRKTSFYSPVLDSINFKMRPIETEGGLFEAKNPSKWRNSLKPDPEVDEAWEDLEIIRVFPITEAEVRRLGKDPELLVKFPQEYGLGDNAYMAQIDMLHQIHCLNLLRHLAWAEYNRNGTAKKPFSDLHWIHVSHCTDILMQNLMCNGNLDIITFNWVETQSNPFPDFAVNHQCRDFDAIYEWQDKHSVPKEWGRNVTRPAGAKQIPISEEYYRIYGIEKPQVSTTP
ncbi:tat pathway signal sequence [Fusarium acutatum]|uniref:Tat pathway signal sequence n=1 Tax=Fusarium acutatum TaxID=78861 RepID=A0A8H4JP45_9HYPO|nr:tat pathway signal sequence [Fusarium acutatum]